MQDGKIVAAALNAPVGEFYALANPQHRPWQMPQRALYQDVTRKYCYKSICPMGHHEWLRMVGPDYVMDAVLGLLRETETGERRINKVEGLL